jgi:hypothetical protein
MLCCLIVEERGQLYLLLFYIRFLLCVMFPVTVFITASYPHASGVFPVPAWSYAQRWRTGLEAIGSPLPHAEI